MCLVGARVKVAGLITTREGRAQPFSCLPKAATSLLSRETFVQSVRARCSDFERVVAPMHDGVSAGIP